MRTRRAVERRAEFDSRRVPRPALRGPPLPSEAGHEEEPCMITRRQLVGALAALAVSAAMAGSAFAAALSGTWKSEFQGPDGNSRTQRLHL